MKKGILMVPLLMWSTLSVNATELKRDGWNLISICQDMNQSEIDMTGIQEIQSQEGQSIYTGDWADYSNLDYLHAGYGYWVKGENGINFNSGESSGKLSMPLHRDGWNLMGSCEDIPSFDINMSDWNLTEIQNQDGESIYTNDWSEFSNLSGLSKGYGYWVKGDSGTLFTSKRGLSIPQHFDYQTINNLGETIETTYEDYVIKLFVDYNETANSQANHTGIVVRINGQDAPIMQIQDTYRGQHIVVGIYDIDGKLIGVSDTVVVETEGSGTFIDVEVEENHPPIYEYPRIDIWAEMVVQEGENSSFWFGTRDIDSLRLADGTPDFVTLISQNQPVASLNMPRGIKKNMTINAENWASYEIEINSTMEIPQGYYRIELIGTNNALGVEVREYLNLFYGDVAIPAISFQDFANDPMMPPMIALNQGDSLNVDFTLQNADNVTVKKTLYWIENPEDPANGHQGKIADFATISGNTIVFNPSTSLEIGCYDMVLTVRDNATGAEVERWIHIDINPEGTNHAPTISLSENDISIPQGATEPVIVTVNVTDADDDNVTFGLDYAPPFVTLVDNEIIIDINGTNEIGMHSVSIYAEDNNSARSYKELKIEILKTEHPMVWLMGEAVYLEGNQTQTWWFGTNDIDSIHLADGSSSFITLEEDNGDEPLSASSINSQKEHISKKNESYKQYRIEITPTADTPIGYYPIEVIGINNNLGVEVNGTLNLFYGVDTPSIEFEQHEINVNQGESRSLNFNLHHADSVEIGRTIRWDSYAEVVSSFANIDGNSIYVHPSLDTKPSWYSIEIIVRDSATAGEVSRWIGVEVNPEESNHSPDINLTVYSSQININSSSGEILATISITDIDGDAVNYGLNNSPSFIILEDNNITYRPDGTETNGEYSIDIYAEDSNGARSNRGFEFELIADQILESNQPIVGLKPLYTIDSRLNYEIYGEEDSTLWANGTSTGLQLVNGSTMIDFERNDSQIITFALEDTEGEMSDESNLTLTLYPDLNLNLNDSWSNKVVSLHRNSNQAVESSSNKPRVEEEENASHYAKYYYFTIDTDKNITIDLASNTDTYLVLLDGFGKESGIIASNDDYNGLNSHIEEYLGAGTYTIEATTYSSSKEGDFNMTVQSNDGNGNGNGNGGSTIPFTEDKVADKIFTSWSEYNEAEKQSILVSLSVNADHNSSWDVSKAPLDATEWTQYKSYPQQWYIDDNHRFVTEEHNLTIYDGSVWYSCDYREEYTLTAELEDRYDVNITSIQDNCVEIDNPNIENSNTIRKFNTSSSVEGEWNYQTSLLFNQPQPYTKDELREQGYDDVTVNGSVEFKETNGTTINAPEYATVKITHQNDNWHPALGFNAVINTDVFSQTEFVNTGKYSDGQMMSYQVYIDNNQNSLLDENEEVLCSENILFEDISNHFVCQREESHEPIVLNNLVSGVINFVDESTPSDAFVRIIPSVFQNDNSGWNGAICKVEDNGSYGQECHIEGNESGIRDAFNNPDETFQMLVFKNHIHPEDYHWGCGEDVYKWVGDSVTSDMFATVDVTSGDYQDRSGEECGENNPTDNDLDGDNIPDSIEAMLGMDNTNPDANDNGILDGLETEGEYGDQFFDKQWHIKSVGTIVNESGVSTIAGNDLDLLGIYQRYMGYNGGNPIIVQIVDDGVDADHEDLIDNMDLSRSYHHSETDGAVVGDPSPANTHNTHGTMVTGIMAARAFNGIGVRGIIPFAKIAGSNWLEYQSGSGLEKAWLTGDGANEIAVTNNSWGTYFTNNSFYDSILEQGTSTLRDGKGRVYVIAAGNDREYYHGNSNLSYISNSRYVVTVGALKNDNTHASYSSPGGNLLISGYSGDYYQNSPTIGTTILEGQSTNSGNINEQTTWSEDENQNYTFAMNGTSAASPTVSGSIALVLEACPDLTWREIKHLLAKQGKKVDNSNESWVQNSAGLWHSNDYGYGLINPQGMIDACTDNNYTHLGATVTAEISSTVNYDLADGDSVNIGGLNIPQNIAIEWIELTVDSNHSQPSDYSIELISPAGTISRVVDWTRAGEEWMSGGFKFGVAGFVDENSSGDWAVQISDFNINDENLSGTINSLKIKVYGH